MPEAMKLVLAAALLAGLALYLLAPRWMDCGVDDEPVGMFV